VVLVFGFAALVWSLGQGGAAGPILPRREIIPGIAADSAPTPMPTPTRTPGPSQPTPTATAGQGPSELVVRIRMVTNEAAFAGSGLVPVDFSSGIEGSLPSGSPLTYLGGAIIEPHPADLCTWEVSYAVTAMDLTASLQTSLFPLKQEVLISIVGPRWHYEVQCPGKHYRVPAFELGDRTLTGWLGLILDSHPTGPVAVETPVYSGSPACLHNRGVVSGSNQWGTVTIWADILTPPCNPPPP